MILVQSVLVLGEVEPVIRLLASQSLLQTVLNISADLINHIINDSNIQKNDHVTMLESILHTVSILSNQTPSTVSTIYVMYFIKSKFTLLKLSK